jgi:predicted dehydrogenase
MSTTRWAILSTSNFAAEKFIPGLRRASGVEVVAVASRDAARAASFAQQCSIPTSYGSYEEMLADPSIDVVYNPLPNHLHVPWTAKAVEAGKHVLCEKPMGLNAGELETLRPLTTRRHIGEAFMVRHHPQWTEVRNRIRAGEIGELTHAHVAFAYTNTDPRNIRNIADVGGGAMYDIGCYAVVAARWFFETEPVRALGMSDIDPAFGTDRRFSAILDMGGSRAVQFSVATQSVPHQRVHLFGTRGRIEITVPFNQPQTLPVTYFVHHGESLDGLDATAHHVDAADQYALLAESFSRQIQTSEPDASGLDDAIAQAKVIDAVLRSVGSGRFESISHGE